MRQILIMANKKIKAVLFDLGETLLNFGRVEKLRLFREGALHSYNYLRSLGQPTGGFGSYCLQNLVALHIRCWISNITRRDFDSLVLLKWIGAKKGICLDAEQWEQFAWLWYEPLSRIGRLEPGIKETLTALKKLGIKLGIVSNTFVHRSSLERHLEQLGILGFFSARVYSSEVKFRKPDVRIFKTAAEKIGEELKNIMFVGDRIDTDIRPAMKAGMQAVLKTAYTNSGRKPPEGAWEIKQLSELPALIERINAESIRKVDAEVVGIPFLRDKGICV